MHSAPRTYALNGESRMSSIEYLLTSTCCSKEHHETRDSKKHHQTRDVIAAAAADGRVHQHLRRRLGLVQVEVTRPVATITQRRAVRQPTPAPTATSTTRSAGSNRRLHMGAYHVNCLLILNDIP